MRASGPRRWSDEWVYRTFEKNQDRLFEITTALADKITVTEDSIAELERGIGRKFGWLYTLIISTLIALIANLILKRSLL